MTNNDFVYIVFEQTPENIAAYNGLTTQFPEIPQEQRERELILRNDMQYQIAGNTLEPVLDEHKKYQVPKKFQLFKVPVSEFRALAKAYSAFDYELYSYGQIAQLLRKYNDIAPKEDLI